MLFRSAKYDADRAQKSDLSPNQDFAVALQGHGADSATTVREVGGEDSVIGKRRVKVPGLCHRSNRKCENEANQQGEAECWLRPREGCADRGTAND